MTFGDIFRDRELLVWVDHVPTRSARPCMAIVTRPRWRLCLTPSTYCSRAFRPLPDSCTSLGRRTPLIFLVACPLCVEMDPMLWTQIDSGLLLRVS